MADPPETPGDESKLQLPKLGFGFGRKKKASAEASAADTASGDTTATKTASQDASGHDIATGDDATGGIAIDDAASAPAAEATAETSVEAETPPPVVEGARAGTAGRSDSGEGAPGPTTADDDHADRAPQTDGYSSTTAVAPDADLPERTDQTDGYSTTTPVASDADLPERTDQIDDEEDRRAAERAGKPRREFRLPALDPRIAAVVAGAVVGLGIVVLTFLSERGCAAVKGTASCGGIGLLLLVAILALAVLLGAALLRAFGIGDALSSSFLAVGLVAASAMLFFLPAIDSVWMVLVIPLLTAATYLFSWWLTRTFIETADDA